MLRAAAGCTSSSSGSSAPRRMRVAPVVLLLCLWAAVSLCVAPADGLRQNSTVSTALSHTIERPAYIALEPVAGTLLISDQGKHNIYRLHLNGTVALVAGGTVSGYSDGTGTSAQFASPWGIAVLLNGTVFVCDALNNRVRSIDGQLVDTIAGSGVAGRLDSIGKEAQFDQPRGVAWNRAQNVLYIADSQNHQIRQINLNTRGVSTYAGTSSVGRTTDVFRASAKFNFPSDVVYDDINHVLYIADTKNGQLRSVDWWSGLTRTLVGNSVNYQAYNLQNGLAANLTLSGPLGLGLSPDGSVVYIADTTACAVRYYSVRDGILETLAGWPQCGSSVVDGPASIATFAAPYSVAYFPNMSLQMYPTLLVADTNSSRIRRVSIPVETETLSMSSEGPTVSASVSDGPVSADMSVTSTTSFSIDGSSATGTAPSGSTQRSVTLSLSSGGSITQSRSNGGSTTSSRSSGSSTTRAGSSSDTPRVSPLLSPSSVLSPSASRTMCVSITQSPSDTRPHTNTFTLSSTHSWQQVSLTPTIEQDATGTTSDTLTPSPSVHASPSDSAPTLTASRTKPISHSGSHTVGGASVSQSQASATASRSDAPSPSQTVTASRTVAVSASISNEATPSASSTPSQHRQTQSISLSPSSELVMSESPSRSHWDCGSTLGHSVVSLVSVVEGLSPPSYLAHPSLVLLPAEAVSAFQDGGRREYNGSTEVPLLAAPLPRIPLLTRTDGRFPLLHLNVSVLRPTAALRWRIVRAMLSADHDQLLLFEAATLNTEGHHDLLLRPPPNATLGWLPDDTFLYRTTELLLSLDLECDGNPVGTLRIAVPSPGASVPLSEEVTNAARITQWASILSGSGSGSSVGRVAAIRSMALCSSDDASGGGGLLGIRINNNGCTHNNNDLQASIEYARGAVVGNTALVVGAFALMGMCTVLLAQCAHWRPLFAFRRLSLPSTLFPLWIVIIPSTAGATALLAAASVTAGCASDLGFVMLGAVLCLGPLALCVALWLVYVPKLGLFTTCAAQRRPAAAKRGTWTSWVSDVVSFATRRRVHWSSSDKTNNTAVQLNGRPERHAWVLLLEFSRLWYAPLDALVLTAAGALGAVSGLGSASSMLVCYGTVGTILCLYLAQLAVCIACRPLATLFSLVHAGMTLALSCGSVAFQLAYYTVVSSAGSANDGGGLWMMEASAVCDLLVVGITMLRIAVDLYDVVKSIRRIAMSAGSGTIGRQGDARATAGAGGDVPSGEEDEEAAYGNTDVSSADAKAPSRPPMSNDPIENRSGSPPAPPLQDWTLNEHLSGSEDDDILRRDVRPRDASPRKSDEHISSWAASVDIGADPLENLFWDDDGKAVRQKFTMLEFNGSGSGDDVAGRVRGDDAGAATATILMAAPTRGRTA